MNDNTNEKLWNFPCDFPIKIMGLANPEFKQAALAIIRAHVNDLQEDAIKTRLSKDGKYLAITVTVRASSKDFLDAIYQELTAHELILVAL